MPDKITQENLTPFGKCLIDKHYNTSFEKALGKKAPSSTSSQSERDAFEAAKKGVIGILKKPEESPEVFEKNMKDNILNTVGVEGILRANQQALQACSGLVPPNTPNTIQGHTKAAKTERT
jgi:hypothetical protein